MSESEFSSACDSVVLGSERRLSESLSSSVVSDVSAVTTALGGESLSPVLLEVLSGSGLVTSEGSEFLESDVSVLGLQNSGVPLS